VSRFSYNQDGNRCAASPDLNRRVRTSGATNLFLIDSFNPTAMPRCARTLAPTQVPSLPIPLGMTSSPRPARPADAGNQYFLYDGHGSTRQLADASGPSSRFTLRSFCILLDASRCTGATLTKLLLPASNLIVNSSSITCAPLL